MYRTIQEQEDSYKESVHSNVKKVVVEAAFIWMAQVYWF